MEQPQLTVKPLTLPELSVMALRYADNAQITTVIEQAMTRRLSAETSGTAKGIQHELDPRQTHPGRLVLIPSRH